MKLKAIFLSVALSLALQPLVADEAPPRDSVHYFRFVPSDDMFYVPFADNEKELSRLRECVARYKDRILSGEIPLQVDGYCSSQPSEAENLALAKTRSNRVKSELIVHSGLTEDCFLTRNHSSEGDYVTVRLTVPADDSTEAAAIERERAEQARLEAERERLAREQAEKERAAREQEAREQAERERAEAERLAAEQAALLAQQAAKPKDPSAGWYLGIQGGVPFGLSAMSSFGEDKTRAGWSAGIYGGYRFNTVLSLELQAAWGQTILSSRDCCQGYWLGSDGNLYEAAVAGMTGWDWHNLMSRVSTQRYGVQLNVNLLGFFNSTKYSRWSLELAPHLYAIGTSASFSTLGDGARALEGTTRWHLGAGGNLQAGYALSRHLKLALYTGLTYLTGQPLDGTPSHLHKENYIWETGLKLGWSFVGKEKEGTK